MQELINWKRQLGQKESLLILQSKYCTETENQN